MHALAITSLVLALAWSSAAVAAFRAAAGTAQIPTALTCAGAAAAHAGAAAWSPLAPLTIAAWLGWALALPRGSFDTAWRRVLAPAAGAALAGWTVVLAAAGRPPGQDAFLAVALAAAAFGVGAVAARYRRGGIDDRRGLQWVAAAAVLLTGFAIVCVTLHVMIGSPHAPRIWLAASLVLLPVGQLLGIVVRSGRSAAWALTETIAAAGVAVLVAVVYLVVVVGIDGPPKGHERGVLLASLAAATAVVLLAVPVRHRLIGIAAELVGSGRPSTEEVVTTFGARMSRAVPMDELMLQLVESLHATVAGDGAEIWTGTGGVLTRTVSMPGMPSARISLGERERVVIARARIGGAGWIAVWVPQLLPGDGAGDVRVVPVAHLGELLALIVVHRSGDAPAFAEDDERPLVELARQLGLALHNVRLDSALQASLDELAERNEELQASRLRIVTAADESRRAIERNLHDGAQQHLVALAVKLGLAAQIAEDGDTETVRGLVSDLRADVQTTIAELRELAHGIYPPLLRDRGLGEALRTAARRSPLPCSVEVELAGRYPEQVETAVYFCCLEAMQNAGKHAGDGAQLTVRVATGGDLLCVEVSDNGAGFDASEAEHGSGFVNMRDRLGAIGAILVVESSPGAGTRIGARVPTRPLDRTVHA